MPAKKNTNQQVDVCIGSAGASVGRLTFVKRGQRENSVFAYAPEWLQNPERFEVSPDLPLVAGHISRRAKSASDSVFHFALADTTPDAWGRRVIARAHAKLRKETPELAALTELDYLCAVDDFSRVGALRLRHGVGMYLRTVEEGKRTTPPLIELEKMVAASRAVEDSTDTAEDLRYLQGKGTSLGGMRPKCTVLDENERLAIGKFPSMNDSRSVTRGEVLALQLARKAGIRAASARIVVIRDTPVAIVERFDRAADHARIPYLSAASMLQASRDDTHSYAEIADIIRARCVNPSQDARELWRRMLFNLLITNTDDHLQNHGFLYAGNGNWQLAPAFDLNPMPDKDRESKTWLTPESGPIDTLAMLLGGSAYFSLTPTQALEVLAQVLDAVEDWRATSVSAAIGLQPKDLADFENAFEHEAIEHARGALGRPLKR
ncbi:type II toxin-antitoxin system HipA family toxin [Rhodoferax sp.]|uniref:type II toxin-antitoxin system HipA family toxin n=1 Tax=Rhodoferax sp. TaxID=50421 RepID=UPI0027616DA4|nr:type II toxin-antitoxin system HipA family toxin [Rhodoferax sp.]